MPERERTVLMMYYYDGLTLTEIGDVLGVTESRVCQIHTKALRQLRSKLADRPESVDQRVAARGHRSAGSSPAAVTGGHACNSSPPERPSPRNGRRPPSGAPDRPRD